MLGYKRERKQFCHAEDKAQPGCTRAQKCHLIVVDVFLPHCIPPSAMPGKALAPFPD